VSFRKLVIDASDALGVFRKMLADAGFNESSPDPAVAWQAFKHFCEIPVNCAGDGVLFQTGTYAFSGEPSFQLDFTRQFSFEEDGEYAGMEQLHCTFHFRDVADLETNVWSSTFGSLADFFAEVEALAEFQLPIAKARPFKVVITQEEV
jgi:hypothetical protein